MSDPDVEKHAWKAWDVEYADVDAPYLGLEHRLTSVVLWPTSRRDNGDMSSGHGKFNGCAVVKGVPVLSAVMLVYTMSLITTVSIMPNISIFLFLHNFIVIFLFL